MRAFIYCRVSTREQSLEDHYSLDNQERRGRDYCALKGWSIAKVRKDVASGKNASREGFQELLGDIRAGLIDTVVVYRLDRLSRNVQDIYSFLDLVRECNVGFASSTEGFDTTTAMGRAMLGIAAVFAQLTREMISENVKDGMLRRMEAGLVCGGGRLFGYAYEKGRGLSVDAEEARVVQEIFDWYTENKWGQSKIAHTLNLRGVGTRAGGQWSPTRVRYMLLNPLYCGLVRLKESNTLVEGRHTPIISKVQFDAAQALCQSRSPSPPRTQHSPHLLSGLAVCGDCGIRLKVHYVTTAVRKRTGESSVYRFYKHRENVRTDRPPCLPFTKTADVLEEAVVKQVGRIATEGRMRALAAEEIKARLQVSAAPMVKERDQLLSELHQIGERFSLWADRLDSGKIDEEQFASQNQRLLVRKHELQKRLELLDRQVGDIEAVEVTLAEVQKALENFPAVWEELETEERRELLRLLVEELKVYPQHAQLKLVFLDAVTLPLRVKRGPKPGARNV